MDEYIFNYYMKYQKANNPDIAKKLKKLPKSILIIFLLVMGSFLGGIVSLFSGNVLLSSIFLICEAGLSLLCYFCFENYMIKNSDKSIENQQEYCVNISEWLKTIDIDTDDKIQLVYNRLVERIEKNNESRQTSINRIEKWSQVLLVPILICIISEIIKSDVGLGEAIASSFVVVIIAAFAFSLVYILYILKSFPNKRKIVQMQYFADDLRAILDCKQLFGSIDFKEKSEKDNVQVCKG